nr:MAG TPA: tail completion protein [Caudoviricetes sp.]
MGSRLDLQNLLESVLGSRNVYYQPPESIRINYPAIIYSRNDIDNTFADDIVYMQNHTYQVIVIDANPDSKIVNKISKLPMCRYDRHYTSDNLNHDVFIINY